MLGLYVNQKALVDIIKKDVQRAIDLRKDKVQMKLTENFRGSIHEIKYIEEMFHVKQIEAELQEHFIRYIIKASTVLQVENGTSIIFLEIKFKRK